jgi:Acetyltransferases, including N-acetylases of ribosomal proteins
VLPSAERGLIRLGLRPTELFDAPAIQRLAQDSQLSRFIYWDDPFPGDGGRRLALAAVQGWHARQAFSFSIFVDCRFAGMVSIDRIDWQVGSGHLFYWLGVPYWNRGAGSWAVGQVVQWASRQRRLIVLYANCLAENERSQRLLKRTGFREISEFIGAGEHGGKFAGRRWVKFSRTLSPNAARPQDSLVGARERPALGDKGSPWPTA